MSFRTGSSAKTEGDQNLWWNVLSTVALVLRLEEIWFPAHWKCCTSTLRCALTGTTVRSIMHQGKWVTAKACGVSCFGDMTAYRWCLTSTVLVSESVTAMTACGSLSRSGYREGILTMKSNDGGSCHATSLMRGMASVPMISVASVAFR